MTNKMSSFGNAIFTAASVAVAVIAVQEFTRPAPQVISESEIREVVKREIASDPKFVLDAIQGYMDAQQAAEVRKQDEQVLAVKDQLADNADRPFTGNTDGAVELVYFFDVNCVYCKKIDPVLKRIAEDNPDVRISHREIPILAESSKLAAIYSNIVWEKHPSKYPEMHDAFLSHNGTLSAPIIESMLVEILGPSDAVDVIAEGSNSSNELTKKSISLVEENLKLAQAAGITGTPFVFVVESDGVIRGASENAYDQIMDLVAQARK